MMTVALHKLTVIGSRLCVPETKVDYRPGSLPQHFDKPLAQYFLCRSLQVGIIMLRIINAKATVGTPNFLVYG